MMDATRNQGNETQILANLYAEVKLTDGLKFKSIVEARQRDNNSLNHTKKYDFGLEYTNAYNFASESMDLEKFWQIENTLSYEKMIGKHSINAFIGQSASKFNTKSFNAYRRNLPDGIWSLNAGTTGTNDQSSGGSSGESTLDSYFGRAIYSYDNRYSITASMRRDGSSRFGKLNPYGNFPSFSAYWNVANETFFKNLGTPVTELKFRGSWGKNGNQEIGDYQYIANIDPTGVDYGNNTGIWNGTIERKHGFAEPEMGSNFPNQRRARPGPVER